VFPDPRLAKAVVDRLTHRAHIIDTGTESWRFRHERSVVDLLDELPGCAGDEQSALTFQSLVL
jgi:hypothetical protein